MYLIRYIKQKNDTRFISRFEKHWSDDQFHGLLASEAHPVKAGARPVWTGAPLGQTLGIIFSLIPWTQGLYSAQSKYYQLGFFRRVAETDEPLLFLLMIRWLDTDQNPIEKAKNKTKQNKTETNREFGFLTFSGKWRREVRKRVLLQSGWIRMGRTVWEQKWKRDMEIYIDTQQRGRRRRKKIQHRRLPWGKNREIRFCGRLFFQFWGFAGFCLGVWSLIYSQCLGLDNLINYYPRKCTSNSRYVTPYYTEYHFLFIDHSVTSLRAL